MAGEFFIDFRTPSPSAKSIGTLGAFAIAR
jgi:hypothetical protein